MPAYSNPFAALEVEESVDGEEQSPGGAKKKRPSKPSRAVQMVGGRRMSRRGRPEAKRRAPKKAEEEEDEELDDSWTTIPSKPTKQPAEPEEAVPPPAEAAVAIKPPIFAAPREAKIAKSARKQQSHSSSTPGAARVNREMRAKHVVHQPGRGTQRAPAPKVHSGNRE